MLEVLVVSFFLTVGPTNPPCSFILDVIDEVKTIKDKGASREEAQEQVNYIDRPGLDFPRVLGDRAYVLQKASVATVYDFLNEHPSGGFGELGHTV